MEENYVGGGLTPKNLANYPTRPVYINANIIFDQVGKLL